MPNNAVVLQDDRVRLLIGDASRLHGPLHAMDTPNGIRIVNQIQTAAMAVLHSTWRHEYIGLDLLQT
ncbi:unannotated protein [freshwater metagenome]|uniref:Unannotated protein n=1 Tax=freshwater metagenome TaxID=449393 RepID=A0A6J6GPH1_9ZZZZ